MHTIKTPDELRQIAEDLRSTASSLHGMLDALVPDSDFMKDVFLKWPQMIQDAANKLDPPANPFNLPPAWPGDSASAAEVWEALGARLAHWRGTTT